MAAVGSLSASQAVFKSVKNFKLKDSPSEVPSRRTEGLRKKLVNGRWLCDPSHRFLKEFNHSTLRIMSPINGEASTVFAIMVACPALRAMMEYQVEQLEQNRSPSNGNGYQRRSREEPESARLCVKI